MSPFAVPGNPALSQMEDKMSDLNAAEVAISTGYNPTPDLDPKLTSTAKSLP